MAQQHLPPEVEPVRLGRPATYADLEALPENMRGELLEGQLYALPRPVTRHHRAQLRLGTLLDGPFGLGRGGRGGWQLSIEEEVHLPGDVVVPDLAGWRTERLPSLPVNKERIRIVPDWVCEVLSDGTHTYDRGLKMTIYAKHKVPHVWLVDPEERTLEAYHNDGGAWRRLGIWWEEEKVRVVPFEAVELELGLLWR